MNALIGSDLYLKHVDKHGHSHVQRHRVWDSRRFIESQVDSARKEGGDVLLSTEDEFKKQLRR